MVICKVLNNNVVVVEDAHGKEQILMGCGIAFGKRTGDFVAKKDIEKVFALTSADVSGKFQELISEIPMESMEVSAEIISYAKTKLGKKLNDSIYISLTDHLHTAIERHKAGIAVKNVLLWDIKRFFADEYQIGIRALDMVEESFDIRLPNDEAGFLALHIVNAEMDEVTENMYEITSVMQEITSIVKYYFKIEFDEESVYFYRFVTHLKFFAQRLINLNNYADENDDNLLETIREKYPDAYLCVMRIGHYIQEKYHYTMSNEEKLYLTIHIARVVAKNPKRLLQQ
ncbi:PRD domain-containing protein [Gottschalkiaceae bacterium SANA]|nr:PRD domain-containing protein [Gottschalkiaceae bacterium SANA]